MSIIVAKFGGTSMETSDSLKQVADIIQQYDDELVVVVSALSGTTDALISLGGAALAGNSWQSDLDELIERHHTVIMELGISLDLSGYHCDIRDLLRGVSLIGELSSSALDRLMSFGERMSSEILSAFLNAGDCCSEALDAFDFISTDDSYGNGIVQLEKSGISTLEVVSPLLDRHVVPVVTGFIAQSASGHYITLGRGGSDYSASLLASFLNAGALDIWTDVDGIFNADPRLIPEAFALPELSFHEASELAYFGAKVLHPQTIKPAVAQNIPVRILNTFHPSAPGTLIGKNEEESLKSVTFKKGITIVNICSSGMLDAHGFLSRIFDVFTRHQVVVDVVSTSEVSVSLTVDNGDFKAVLPDLEEFSTVTVHEHMAIVCLVGNGIRSNTSVLSRLFTSIVDCNVSMVSQGASKRNITFLIDEEEVESVVRRVFSEFFYS
jgi:aspartate kinase